MSQYKSLVVLKKSQATTSNLKHFFTFERGIRFNKWRLKSFYITGSNTKVFIHCPQLEQKTINNTILGNEEESDIICFHSGSISNNSQDTDRHTFYLNEESLFYELQIYFTDGSTLLDIDDFVIILDIEKETILY